MINLSVIIPTYNESKRLPKTLMNVVSYLQEKEVRSEIIISDGGSTDGTVDFVEKYQKDSLIEIKIIKDRRREGKGWGVKKGMLAADGNWILFMDADGSTSISQLIKLEKYKDEYDVIIGSRYAGIEADVKQNLIRRAVSKLGGYIIRIITGLDIRDTQCGFKLFSHQSSRDIFGNLQTRGWGFDVEVLLLARKFDYRIKEVPVKWRDSEGSHLRAGQDSIKAFFEILRARKNIEKKFRFNEKITKN